MPNEPVDPGFIDIPFDSPPTWIADVPIVQENPAWWHEELPPSLAWYRTPRPGRVPTLQLRFDGDSYCPSLARWEEAFNVLLDWLSGNGLVAYVNSDYTIGGVSIGQLPLTFKVDYPDQPEHGRKVTEDFLSVTTCGSCKTEHLEAFHGACPNIPRYAPQYLPYCDACGWITRESIRLTSMFVGTPNEYLVVRCTGCLGPCAAEGCEDVCMAPFTLCSGCAEIQAVCPLCEDVIELEDADDFDGVLREGVRWCAACGAHRCYGCRYPYREETLMRDDQGRTFCPECFVTSGTETNDPGDLDPR
jgi:hypothetical protein